MKSLVASWNMNMKNFKFSVIFPKVPRIDHTYYGVLWNSTPHIGNLSPIAYYSVFLLLRRLTYKLSSEAGNGEVTNPK